MTNKKALYLAADENGSVGMPSTALQEAECDRTRANGV